MSAEEITTSNIDPRKWHDEKLWIDRAWGKAMFGSWNFFLGWTVLMKEPYETATLGDNFFVGLGRGVVYGVADTAGGLLNVVTFPLTFLQIPLPEGGVESREF